MAVQLHILPLSATNSVIECKVDIYSKGKLLVRALLYLKNVLSKLPTYWRLRNLFGSMMKRQTSCYISLPSIFIGCVNDNNVHSCAVRPYKQRYKMPGDVRTDLPWIRPNDTEAASIVRATFADFVENIRIVPDETRGSMGSGAVWGQVGAVWGQVCS